MKSYCWCLFSALVLVVSDGHAGVIETIAGTGQPKANGSAGQATKLNISQPFGVEVGPDGHLYITEVGNHRVWKLNLSSGKMTVVAGNGKKGYTGDGGPATKASLNEPYEVRFAPDGDMYFVEMQNHLIRVVDAQTGIITTLAGTGQQGYAGDGGPAKKAQFSQPHSIALDEQGNVYVADIANHRIRKIDIQTGIIDSIVGNGEKKLPEDGKPGKGNPIYGPRALYIHDGVLWIALREGNSVWKMNLADGIIHHVAGTGKKGYTGDGGPAASATFEGPKGIAIGPDRNVYISDTENQTIRVIDLSTGNIKTIAGRGPKFRGYAGDGKDALKASLDRAHGLCVGPDGSVYIGDTNNHRVRRVRPSH